VFQTRSGASAFEIIVSDPELKWQGKPTFTDAKEVKIELGTAGKLKKIFDGEITAWRTELERSGPSVLVLRGLDRSHRMMRAKKTKTYANASPIDCAQQIASQYGLTAKTRAGDELWSVPGVKPGAQLAKFASTKPEISVVASQVGTQEHADTVAKAALTKRAMEFITAEVEVQGNPVVRPGALVNIKKVGAYSGHYLVTEANHFYDAAGYNCIFYVARDKRGNSSQPQQAAQPQQQAAAQQQATPAVVKDGIHRRLVDEETGDPLANVD